VSMQLDLTQLGRHGRADEHVDRTYQPAAFDVSDGAAEGYRVVAPVHLVLDVHKDRDAFRVTGCVETRLELECGRCLERFEIPVDGTFELRYVSQSQNAGHGEREIGEDDLTTAFYRDQTLDLGELMHEQLELALPMKPLCSNDCKGLCPECGANLNTTTCACAVQWQVPRLAALQGLLDAHKRGL
jgi:uncharacterized protein